MPAIDFSRRRAVVVGGGPAGLMAAELLAAAGLQIDVYEHMPSVGRKLLLAGRSGLNITHSEALPALTSRYGTAELVAEAVRRYDAIAVREWCAGLGQATFVGSTGRVFPSSFRATPLLRAWLERLTASGVRIHTHHRWSGWATTADGMPNPHRLRFVGPGGNEKVVAGDVVVFALGGASWPRVGSDGGWVETFRAAGVHVQPLRPANCGVQIAWSDTFVERWAGAPLKNVALGVAGRWVRGDVTITTAGIESGPVYTQSAIIRDTIEGAGSCPINIDLVPDLTLEEVAERLRARRPKDSLSNSLRRTLGMHAAAVAVLRESTGNAVPTDSDLLCRLIKGAPLTVAAMMPIARAISSAGGVAFSEIDEHFMLRRLPGTFVAGEMLDWEAPTGGYLLQGSFSTAVAAAHGALDWLARTS